MREENEGKNPFLLLRKILFRENVEKGKKSDL